MAEIYAEKFCFDNLYSGWRQVNSSDSEPVYMSALRGCIKSYDLDLQIIRIDPLSGMLLLKLLSLPDTSKATLMSIDDLKEMALPMVRRVTASIRRIIIKDMGTGIQ